MKKIIFLYLCLIFFDKFLLAQPLIPFKNFNGLWGYKDATFNQVIIEPQFVTAKEFSEGLAAVSKIMPGSFVEKFGFIDLKGKTVIPFIYLQALSFSEDLATVLTNQKKVVFVNKVGQEIIKTSYTNASYFSKGVAVVELNGKKGLIDKTGKVVVKLEYDDVKDFDNDYTVAIIDKLTVQIDKNGNELPVLTPYGFIDRKTKKRVLAENNYYAAFGFTADGIAITRYNQDNSYGAINAKGETIFPHQFTKIKRLNNGLYETWIKGQNKGLRNKFGTEVQPPVFKQFINYTNKLIIAQQANNTFVLINEQGKITTPSCTDFYKFEGELAKARIDSKFGIINQNGEMIIIPQYAYVSIISNNLIKVEVNNKYGIINNNNVWLIPAEYDYIDIFSDGLIRVQKNNLYTFINKAFKEIFPPKYSFASDYHNGFARVQESYYYTFINVNGKELTKEKFAEAYDFSDGLAAVKINNKWGYINTKGKLQISIGFSVAKPFKNQLAIVGKFGQVGFIDTTGRTVIPFQFDEADNFSENLAAIKINNKWGFINTNGNIIITPQFEQVKAFANNMAAVMLNNKWGYINKNGNLIIPHKYTQAENFSEGFAAVCKDNKFLCDYGYINKQGKEVTPFIYLAAGKFENNRATVKDASRREFVIDTTGREINKYEDKQAEQIYVIFNNNYKNNKSTPAFTANNKKLKNSFSKEYNAVIYNGSEASVQTTSKKIVVTPDYIEEYTWGNGSWVLWGSGCKIVASEQTYQQGIAMQSYLCSSGKIYQFYVKDGYSAARVISSESSYIDYFQY